MSFNFKRHMNTYKLFCTAYQYIQKLKQYMYVLAVIIHVL